MNELTSSECDIIFERLGKLANEKSKPIIATVDIDRANGDFVEFAFGRFHSGWNDKCFYVNNKSGEHKNALLEVINWVLEDYLTFEVVSMRIDADGVSIYP